MTLAEFFVKRWESELPAFGKVLRAVPKDQLGYKPHDRSTSAGDLAWQLAEEQRVLCDLLDTGTIEWKTQPHPGSIDAIVAAWDKATEDLRARLGKLDDAKCAGSCDFVMTDGKFSDSVGNMLWGFLFDMVHHRGQLSAYLRPMGAKVPAIYGPSADETLG